MSVLLTKSFGKKETHFVGKLRKGRKENNQGSCQCEIKKGEIVGLKNANYIIVFKWKEMRDVIMLTTKQHGIETREIELSGGKKNRNLWPNGA